MIFHSSWKHSRKLKPCLQSFNRNLNVLGIESSFDDTGAAVINDSKQILGEGYFSQQNVYRECGGMLSHVGFSLHKKYIRHVINECMRGSQLDFKDLDAIAVTVKPGLSLSLEAGVNFAKELCKLHQKPLVPIHHMEAHALTVRLIEEVKFPFVTLLISGGHCILAFVKSPTEFYRLGQATDSNPGEVIDKVARRAKLNNLKRLRGLSCGAAIEKAAAEVKVEVGPFVKYIMAQKRDCNFSFTGILSNAVGYIKDQEKQLGLEPDERMANVWQVVSGGVASNNFIKSALRYCCQQHGYRLIVPPPKYCTDNGVMIAWNGIERLKVNCPVIKHDELDSIQPIPKCHLGEDWSNDVTEVLRVNGITRKVRLKNFLEEYNANEAEHQPEKIIDTSN
ncbi:hypothetical protein RUM44_009117 [Polyplax serrata]|uniref:N(6)-L-threonylcarbamoyladenine synthase n=1 Tax=Polyplax serrata TaxID=468196 RepID=A0ABR1ARS3_POLSC